MSQHHQWNAPAVPHPAGPDPNPRHVETPQLEYMRVMRVMRTMSDYGFSQADMRDAAEQLERRFASAFASAVRNYP